MKTTSTARETITGTVKLKETASGIEILFNGHTLGLTKDDANFMKRAEKVLRSVNVWRTSGYQFDGVVFHATGTQVV